MAHIIVAFDALEGVPTPDGLAMNFALSLVRPGDIPEGGAHPTTYCTSSHLVIDAARVLRKRGTVSDLLIYYKGERIYSDKDGRLPRWPLGFCDQTETLLDELLGD